MEEILERYERYVLPNYKRNPVALVRGKGSYVWDARGKRYLDFFPGWGVNGLGHCPGTVAAAVRKQLGRLMHVPNNYYHDRQGELAEWIAKKSFGGKSFFCNSGAEANEAAIKLLRKWGGKEKDEIVSALGSFHGRTFAALSATGQPKYQQSFVPMLPGFRHVPFGDAVAMRRAIGPKTAAVILEPIQGEGGVRVAPEGYFKEVRELCDAHGSLLVLDEVQTGMGRTGKFFAYQHYGIVPDIMTLAKALGGGLSIGAMVCDKKLQGVLQPGDHASTFGGNPVACAAAIAMFETIEKEGLLDRAMTMGELLRKGLEKLAKRHATIRELRGLGLMQAAEIEGDGPALVARAMEKGLLINCTAGNVIRFLPSLKVTRREISAALRLFEEVLA